MRVMWIAAVIACSAACSGRPPPAQSAAAPVVVADAGVPVDAAPLDQDLPRLVERSLAMYRDMVQAFTTSDQDCAAAVSRLHELAGRYRDVGVANAKVLHDGRAKQLQAALAPHSAELDAAAAAIMQSPVVVRCAKDREFRQAFDELVAPP
jgi:hypothetical protein